jgi:hypothetical protein
MAVRVTHAEIVERARRVFAEDAARTPPMSLRSGEDADSYRVARPYVPEDAPTQALIGQLAFWALPHLDAESWRHHLPHLIEYGLAHRSDAGDLAVEAIVAVQYKPAGVFRVIAPCGSCRELISDHAPDARVYVWDDGEVRAVAAIDLLPYKTRRAW